ncbi:hypothetical protein SC22_01905 [Bacillus sp. A053]|uniref:hypothetical protein n=1 Tax=Bacillus TaxID=1386 RepID=UPI000589F9D8|nr:MULTISPECIES: hypothetical protein [Bacillus]OIS65338.1 hypothetical protein A4A37_19015 [Bacillus subtilis]ASB62998.1 hypothetical protein CDO84_19280 [Bacillus sp. MD-5]KIH42111.1 hypothetical protein SC22_01905 [Bacillus sp. A053]MDL9993879.1 hypothetical protein [Bacillus stercoris]OIS67060.1 hypothetical protein A4A36_13765 [Bacillus subtilis]
MIYKALVKGLDPHIEEEVILEIDGIEFTGFSSVYPYEIEVGKKYPVLVGFTILDELVIRENKEKTKELERIGLGYQYYIRGILQEDSIYAGIVLTDEDQYSSEYPHLIGKNVEMKVDRISIEFLREAV